MDQHNDSPSVGDSRGTSGGGGAVDDLTPPTMKSGRIDPPSQVPPPGTPDELGATLSMDRDLTRRGPGIGAKTERIDGIDTARGGASTLGLHQVGTVVGDMPAQDLSKEQLLRDAPRMESNGKMCPSLKGIPLVAKLGQGGMGAVYYGIHPRLRSEVAVKVLPLHLAAQDPTMIQRFFREAQIAAKVRSPHLVSVIDVNEESGLFFLVMEYVSGVTMSQYTKLLDEKGQKGLPELDAIDVCIAACLGLEAAHQNGVVHRDLKPENIMVPYKSRQDRTFDLPNAKLMDLGLARSEEGPQSLTNVQAAMGTPGYMAPEQALDAKTASKPSDVFGMGATLYALLTGRRPFGSKDEPIMKVLMATMHEPHEPVSNTRPDVSLSLCEVIDACLDKRPENRYPDATHLLRALRRCRRLIAPDVVAADDDEKDVDGRTPLVPRKTSTPQVPAYRGSAITTAIAVPPVAPRSKRGVAMVAALVVLLGVGAVVARPYVFPKQTRDATDLKILISDHENRLKTVQEFLKSDDLDTAERALKRAVEESQQNADVAQLKILDDAVAKQIEDTKKHKVFLKQLGPLDAQLELVEPDQVAKADEALTKARDLLLNLKPGLPEDQIALSQRSAKKRELELKVEQQRRYEQDMAIARNEAAKTSEALAACERAIKELPDSNEAKSRKEVLMVKKHDEDEKVTFDALLAKAQHTFEENKDMMKAKKEIDAALEIYPNDTAAAALYAKISTGFDKEMKKQIQLDRENFNKEQFALLSGEAKKLLEDKKGTEASAKIERALQFGSSSEAVGLKASIEKLVDDQRKAAELRDKQANFEKLMTKAEDLLNTHNVTALGEAKLKLEQALTLNIDNTRVETLRAKIISGEKFLKDRETFDTAYDEARAAFRERDDVDTALKALGSALAIETAGIDKSAATKLLGEVTARKQNRDAYSGAVESGDDLMQKHNYVGALAAYNKGAAAARALGDTQAKTLQAKLDLAAPNAERMRKAGEAIDKSDDLAKDGRFEEAVAALDEAGKSMPDHPRLAPARAAIEDKRKLLDAAVDKILVDSAAALKTSGLDPALEQLRAGVAVYKTRKDLNGVLAALSQVKQAEKTVAASATGLRQSYDQAVARSGGKPDVYLDKQFASALKNLSELPAQTVAKIAAGDIRNAQAEADRMKGTQRKYTDDANRYLGMREETTSSRPVNQQPTFNPNGNGNTGNSGKGNDSGNEIDVRNR